MIKRNKIPTILGVILLLAGVAAGVFYINMRQIFRIGASTSNQPKDVRISNVSDTGATVSWTTDSLTTDFLSWGGSQNNVSKIEQESANSEKYYTHSINLSGLSPATQYFFKINSNGSSYDNNGVPWNFTTGQSLGLSKNSALVSGSVISTSGQPINRALVYITINGYLASTLTTSTGNFVYQLENVRDPDLQNYAQIDPAATVLEISVIAGVDGVASVQIFPQSADPIPPIVLGKVYDLRNLEPNTSDRNPNADLSLPENSTQGSKFNVSGDTATTSATTVILESLTEGETVTSTKPEFFGKGPAGKEITIEIHSSEQISQTVTVPTDGSWSWAVPTGLSPGAHTITITWKDVSGITRTLTRDFVVQASELPSFEASPSQSIAPTATPTATPKATASASATPKATASSSAAPVPVTGNSTSSILLYIMGVSVISFSFLVWKYAQST